ncbi:MAG: retropepsin-like aspartic protease [Nitrospirae bacterium]|nr:retropepsin-like aspartic protease [Nitrospirota bacterium]
MKTFCGLIIGIAVVISGIAAVFGFGLFIIGHQVQNPETAEYVRQELQETSLLDIVGGNSSAKTNSNPLNEDEIIIPATRRGSHLYVEVELNEYHTAKLMVDTGATDIAIKSEMAYALNLSEAESRKATYNTANGPIQKFVNRLDSVRIGDAVQYNVRASFGDGIKDGFNDGLLGMSFLKHYYIDIDLEGEELHLWPRES